MTSPSAWAISSARTLRCSEVVPANSTRAPSRRAPSLLTLGAVVGITTTERAPARPAANATAWAWLPEE